MKSFCSTLCAAGLALVFALSAVPADAKRGSGPPRAAPAAAAPAVPKVTPPRRPPPVPEAKKPSADAPAAARTFHTYTKTNPKTGEIYVGRTSGQGTPAQSLARRDASHPWTKKGFGPAQLDRSSPNKDAIRGREQQMIERQRLSGTAAAQINGISPQNPNRNQYLGAAKKEFGK